MRSAPACRRKGACNSIDGANHRAQAATAELSLSIAACAGPARRVRTVTEDRIGGGAGAAFGAGALTGLSRAGIRPEFYVVTEVSAGARTEPFAERT
jgi:hypothetical protein